MEPKNEKKGAEDWLNPPAPMAQTEPGYDEWLASELDAGCKELDAGQGIPAEQVWKDLGLE
ncbi:MAG: hypothetical protein AAFY02_09070 [Pseudomonadota bacterium]